MKLKIDPPPELAALSETMRSLLAGLVALTFGAIALSIAALLIALGGRTHAN